MPIIGHGDIVTALREGGVSSAGSDREGWTFFAAGVSNSGETRENEYMREKVLLKDKNWGVHLVYFSSLCVFYSDTRYACHKREMESVIFTHFPSHTIVRLGNITWGDNPHTLINTLRERERLGLPQDIQDIYRYIIDKDEFLHWVKLIPEWSCEMNCPGRRMKVADIYREFVRGQAIACFS